MGVKMVTERKEREKISIGCYKRLIVNDSYPIGDGRGVALAATCSILRSDY